MNLMLKGGNYVVTKEEAVTFLNEYVYVDMVEDGEMDKIEASDDVFSLLVEAISDSCGGFYEPLIEFLNENKEEESKMNEKQVNKVLKGIYTQAINTIIEGVQNRQGANRAYETYLETVEATIQVFNPEFNLEKELELVSRGLNADILRYVTSLDRESQNEQFRFYQNIRRSL